ncbi:flagellar hook-length control protein FliK [Brevibacillus reuszeri]|uniref:flagellar hook-length control protein FliK n=1 Tax=Brevibacillus reuszeri TaxID=54915 RepID=UPI000CCC5481|nr:flagellar hook-length control protein FliK [Brevibacillus reuszeri]
MIANNVVGASTSATMAQGVPASKEGTGLGELFSLQMLSAFQNMSATDELGVAPEGFSEEELKALEEMMALLSQLLSSGQRVPEELMPQIEEKTAAIEQFLGKTQGNVDKLSEEWKQLLAKLPQEEPASAKLEKLAALLEALKNQKANGETGKPSTSASAVHLRSEVMAGTNTTQQDAFKAIQPMRVNAGLAAYKQEAGIQAQTVQPTLQAGLLNQDKPGDEGLTFTNAPVVTTTSQSQPSQTFQQPGVQTHQVHANQLPEQVTQLFVNKMNIKHVNGVHEAKLVLNPQSLGQVDVTIKSHNGVITAQFHAETQAAKDMLDNQLPQLRAALTQQGLQVDRLEVNQQQETAFSFQQQREQARQQGKEQEQQKQSEQEFALDALVDNTESTEDLWNRLRETTSGINDIV